MATDAENIRAAISAIYAEIAAGPLAPSYNIDGQAVDWPAYRASLLQEAAQLREHLGAAEGPWEEITQGMP